MPATEPNILIFGGTTEGKQVAWLLDQLNEPYLYSTKTKTQQKVNGEQLTGGLTEQAIVDLCKNRSIRLMIDAAHPFAEELHKNILIAATQLNIETIRFERIFPELNEDEHLKIFPDFESLQTALTESKFERILALTGVNTIAKLKQVWTEKDCFFRILPGENSAQVVNNSEIPKHNLLVGLPEKYTDSFIRLMEQTHAQVVLSKESGTSGYFVEKAEAARKMGIPFFVVKRPEFTGYTYKVNQLKELQAFIYKLRKSTLKTDNRLRGGFTTGSSITAAAKAALLSLLLKKPVEMVSLDLPSGESTHFVTYCNIDSETEATCTVIKNAGDDPDITHGEEMGCTIKLTSGNAISIKAGKGIGTVTLPGLPVSVGESAINPVPRKMILNALKQTLEQFEFETGLEVIPFVPNGETLAKKTFNPRIGIVNGLSILGTTGKVEPYSNEAFLASINEQLHVAKASGCSTLVLTSGLRSENTMKQFLPNLPDQAYVHFGNLVGDTLQLCQKLEFETIHIGFMLGKAIKLAEGHLNTHSKEVTFNVDFAFELAKQCNIEEEKLQTIKKITLANELVNILPVKYHRSYYELLAERCQKICKTKTSNQQKITFWLLVEKESPIVAD